MVNLIWRFVGSLFVKWCSIVSLRIMKYFFKSYKLASDLIILLYGYCDRSDK